VAPKQQREFDFTFRYPPGEPVGEKTLYASLYFPDDGQTVEIPLSFRLGLADIDVWGTAVIEGDRLVLEHGLTNRTAEVLSFRGTAGVPGRERQYRPFTNVLPGQTQVVRYRVPDAASLVGRHVVLNLREMNDGRRNHNLELLVR
jgi:hypothetical protein